MNANFLGMLHPLSAISSTGLYGRLGNTYQTGRSFGNVLQSQQVSQMKQEIYNQFQIEVGGYGDAFSCYIPSEVLYRMNTDTALKDKVFGMLEKYSGEEFKKSIMGQEPAVTKCTLIFDEQGDMTAALETGTGRQNRAGQSVLGLYQQLLSQQAALMPYQMNMYSGYNSLYGLYGSSNYNMLQNSLFSSMLGLI